MTKVRKKIVSISERYHYVFHLALGLVVFGISYDDTSKRISLLYICLVASIIPDFDHFFYYYLYGSKTEYAKIIKQYLRSRQIRAYLSFCKSNHKSLTGLYSHNLLTPLLAFFVYSFLWNRNNIMLSAFFLSFALHFLFDMFEDFVSLGKLNPNWFLKFNR